MSRDNIKQYKSIQRAENLHLITYMISNNAIYFTEILYKPLFPDKSPVIFDLVITAKDRDKDKNVQKSQETFSFSYSRHIKPILYKQID